jgi:hypothetical protein
VVPAEVLEPFGDEGADGGGALADAAREDEGVEENRERARWLSYLFFYS